MADAKLVDSQFTTTWKRIKNFMTNSKCAGLVLRENQQLILMNYDPQETKEGDKEADLSVRPQIKLESI